MHLSDLVPWKWGKQTPATTEASPFWTLHEEMNRLFEQMREDPFFFPALGGNGGRTLSLMPKLDLSETDEAVEVTVEIPGLDAKDVEITYSDGQLHIKGTKEYEEEKKERNYYRRERRFGSFHRVVPVPCPIDEEKISATAKNGVLTITLPKTAEAQRNVRKIEVKSA